MKEPEKQLGVRIPAALYNALQDRAKRDNVSFKEYIVNIFNKFLCEELVSIVDPVDKSDWWVVALDMGSFDLIILESPYYEKVESYVKVCQRLYKDKLLILKRNELRELVEEWDKVELYTNASVKLPERPKDSKDE